MTGLTVSLDAHPDASELTDWFALVAYLPPPLGPYLDALRKELVPECSYASHVTILPPRQLHAEPLQAAAEIEKLLQDFEPFELEIGELAMFPVTSVLYLELASGRESLVAMHEALNRSLLAYQEPFEFHPHITLAQQFPKEQVEALRALAARRWRDYPGSKRFTVQELAFVQRRYDCNWVNLTSHQL